MNIHKRFLFVFLFLLCGLMSSCSSEPETPLTGNYSSRMGEISFRTTATANLFLSGTREFSGDVYDAEWKRDGKKLTLTTRPNYKSQYQIVYHFDVVDDGAQLILKKIDTTTEATGKTDTTEMPEETIPDLTFNKHT